MTRQFQYAMDAPAVFSQSPTEGATITLVSLSSLFNKLISHTTALLS
jgi:hypothetical protein